VPGVLNRQLPAQPCGDGNEGNGGTGPTFAPAVCVHEVGSMSKSTLWKLPPSGYEKVTVSPALIVTVLSPVAGFSNPKSNAWIEPGARAGSPDASAGTPTAAIAAHANHGRYLFLRPTRLPPPGK
jgi:hypothetical protein